MNIPPWMRQIQQSWIFNLVVVPAALAAAPAIYECAGAGLEHLSLNCFKAGGIAAAAWLVRTFGHSPNSTAFNKDGTTNSQVAEIVKADVENRPVAVIPVASPEQRDAIRDAVAAPGVNVAAIVSPAVVTDAGDRSVLRTAAQTGIKVEEQH